MMYALRRPKHQGFAIYFLPPLDINPSTDDGVALRTLNESIEQVVSHCPEQYQWGYKRFKQRPDGKPSIYDQAKAP